MKKAKDLHKLLDNTLDEIIKENIDHKRGSTIARLAGNKIRLAAEEIKHKKLTGRPDKIEFFED